MPAVAAGQNGAVFLRRGGRFIATELARAPWYPDAQHGGAPAALLMRALEAVPAPDGLAMARVTYELLRPVPLGELEVEAAVTRPGRRIQMLDGSLRTPDGTEVMRARALRVHVADAGGTATEHEPPPPGPEEGYEGGPRAPYRPMFAPDAIEIRFITGKFGGGPAIGWFRLRRPLVSGETPTPLQSLAAAGDFGNGISAVLSWDDYLYINPDLTLYIERQPVGEWIGLESRTLIPAGGIGTSESILYDERGRVGRAIQALLVARRQ
jgi:Acyl-CoA thioesterase C-terminal domain/Acyl-CoA thioesterase N-terminal domain